MNNLQSVKAFLASRRSTPPSLLVAPYPNDAEIMAIAQMGLRVPDHKKLEPWRLVVIRDAALVRLADIVATEAPKHIEDTAKADKATRLYRDAGLVIAMIYTPKDEPSIPEWEQFLSMGAVGVSLVNAAIAHGFGANWVTGFLPQCAAVLDMLGIKDGEQLLGMVHIGTPKSAPPERPRPNIDEKLAFLGASE